MSGNVFMAVILFFQFVIGITNATITGGVYNMAGWLPTRYIQVRLYLDPGFLLKTTPSVSLVTVVVQLRPCCKQVNWTVDRSYACLQQTAWLFLVWLRSIPCQQCVLVTLTTVTKHMLDCMAWQEFKLAVSQALLCPYYLCHGGIQINTMRQALYSGSFSPLTGTPIVAWTGGILYTLFNRQKSATLTEKAEATTWSTACYCTLVWEFWAICRGCL